MSELASSILVLPVRRALASLYLGFSLFKFGSAAFVIPAKSTSRAMKLCESTLGISGKTSNINSVKGVIFDIDGTLSDSWALGFDATKTVLSKNAINQITEEEYHECTRYCTPERLARHAGLTPSDQDFEVIGQKLAAEFDDLYINLVSVETAGFFPGVQELLDGLPTGIPIGALTNACVAYAHAVFSVNLREGKDKFISVHGADDVPAPKPSPEGLWLVCKELGVAPGECVYVGE
jgi:phosphoglycolate phosphatase